MSKSKFERASDAVLETLEYVQCAESLAKEGEFSRAKRVLRSVDAKVEMYFDFLSDKEEELARACDGPIVREGPKKKHTYTSAHMAVRYLWGTISVNVAKSDYAVRPDFCEYMGLNVSELKARIISERANLFGQQTQPNAVSEKALWLGEGKVRVGNETKKLESQLSDVLQALVEMEAATTPDLIQKSGRVEAPKLLRKIVKKFPMLEPYISFPGKRGSGGYSTTIIDARS